VAKPSFASLKQQFDEACTSLRSFTLGSPKGSTQRAGEAAVERVLSVCERLRRLFTTGPHAADAATLVVSGRTRVSAAEARLALLRKKRGVWTGLAQDLAKKA